jgi:glycosyltransferase involved in cell wall biosynthesis
MRLRSGQQVDGTGKPRVLFVSHTARWAGPTNSLLLLLRRLRDRFDVRVLLPGEGDFSGVLQDEGIPFSSLPALSKGAIPGILRLVRRHRIDLVYGNNTSGACRNALIAAKLARVPFICHIREMGRIDKRRHLAFLRFADATVAVSEACAASVPEFRGRTRYVVHNGIETGPERIDRTAARAHMDATTGTAPGVPVIVSVSHLNPRKGQEYAVRALAELTTHGGEAQLLLVGSPEFDPQYVERLHDLIRELGLESRVIMAGFRRDVSRLLQGADLLLHTAIRDPHPRAVLEAMAAGLPVVAFAVDGVAETVLAGETGELVTVGDVAGLATAARRILEDPAAAAERGHKARERVEQHFSADRTARKVRDIIESSLSNKEARGDCRTGPPLDVPADRDGRRSDMAAISSELSDELGPSQRGGVCMVISSFRPRVGGAEQLTERLSAELKRRGIPVTILTRRFPGLARHESVNDVLIHRLGLQGAGKLAALTFSIHTLCALAFRFRRFEIVHVQNSDTPLLVGLLARLLLRRRLFLTVHSEPDALFGAANRVTGPIRLRLAARYATGIVALSEEMSRELIARGVPSQRLSVLAGGIDIDTFHPPTSEMRRSSRRRIAVAPDALLFLYVGRLVALKQVDHLLRAWALLPPAPNRVLLVVGSGPEEQRLRALADQLELSTVQFRPFTDRVVDYLHAADVFVLPSLREGLSVALMEALATGLAVLASDLPGNRAVVQSGHNGVIFSPGDAQALAAELLTLHDPRLRQRLGAAAADTVRSRYSLRQLANQHQQLYYHNRPNSRDLFEIGTSRPRS